MLVEESHEDLNGPFAYETAGIKQGLQPEAVDHGHQRLHDVVGTAGGAMIAGEEDCDFLLDGVVVTALHPRRGGAIPVSQLGIGPEGKPHREFFAGEDAAIEIARDHLVEAGAGIVARGAQVLLPHVLVFLREVVEGFLEQPFLGIEMEVHEPDGNLGLARDALHRGAGGAVASDDRDGCLDQGLPPPVADGFVDGH